MPEAAVPVELRLALCPFDGAFKPTAEEPLWGETRILNAEAEGSGAEPPVQRPGQLRQRPASANICCGPGCGAPGSPKPPLPWQPSAPIKSRLTDSPGTSQLLTEQGLPAARQNRPRRHPRRAEPSRAGSGHSSVTCSEPPAQPGLAARLTWMELLGSGRERSRLVPSPPSLLPHRLLESSTKRFNGKASNVLFAYC